MKKKSHWMYGFAIILLAGCGGGGTDTSLVEKRTEAGSESTVTAAACAAHGAPSDLCFLCDASLRDPSRLWCREHARYEDRCWICHPEMRDEARLYCEEHGLYEDECFACHPEVAAGGRPEASSAGHAGHDSSGGHADPASSGGLFCNEHTVAESQCGICQPQLADGLSPGEGLLIRFASDQSAALAGIETQPAQPTELQESVTAVGELGYNLNALARITPPVGGIVRKLHADLGSDVVKGDVLAEVSAPDISEVKSTLLAAAAEEGVAAETLARERELFSQKITAEQDLLSAEARHSSAAASLREAKHKLRDLGFGDAEVERILETGEGGSILTLRAPFSGTITKRSAVVGDVVSRGDPLFVVCDLANLWLDLAVPEAEVASLQGGEPVIVESRSLERPVYGSVTWVASELDPATRMAKVRAEVPNPQRLLRAGMYVTAEIGVRSRETAMVLDRESVHQFGGLPFVFLALEPDLFEVRRVEVCNRHGDSVGVLDGLDEGDQVVVAQGYFVKSEFQKSRLGAGCAD